MSEEAKKKEESAVGYIPPLLQGVYRGLEEWKILDESRTGYAVADLSTGQRKFLWANKAALSWMFKRPLEKMADIDLNNAQSQAVRDNLAMIYNKVQCNGDTNIDVKTVYFEGKPNTLKIFSSPVRCVPPGSEEEKTVVLFEYTSMNDGNFDEFQKFWRLSSELLRHVELMVMSFDASTETQEVFYQNNKAKAFYKDAFKEGEAGLKRWCDTCVFDPESEDAMTCSELHARIVSQKVEDKPIEFDCCKKTAPEHVHEHIAEEDTPTWHHVIIKVVYDPNTAKPSIFVQEHPVTMLKQVQKHLLQAHAAQEAFFVSISHELRSPLNGVIGLCSSLVQDKNLDKSQLKTLRLIQSSGQRMLAIVNDILDAGSVKHGELVVKQENVSLAQVCTDVCEVLRPLVQRGASLRSQVSGVTCPRVRGDEGRIMQILTNLVSNAIKFTHRGSVTIEAKEDKHGMVLVEIHDDGVGIAADKLSEIWGAFKQADRATTQKYGGTGLGLPLVKKLVQAHGGRVGCRSVIGTGSTFWFTLPIVAPSSPLATGRRLSTASIECEASMLERQDSWHKEGGRAEPEHRRREEEEKEERGSERERERARARLLQVEKRLEEEQQRSRSLQDEVEGLRRELAAARREGEREGERERARREEERERERERERLKRRNEDLEREVQALSTQVADLQLSLAHVPSPRDEGSNNGQTALLNGQTAPVKSPPMPQRANAPAPAVSNGHQHSNGGGGGRDSADSNGSRQRGAADFVQMSPEGGLGSRGGSEYSAHACVSPWDRSAMIEGTVLQRALEHERIARAASERRQELTTFYARQRDVNTMALLQQLLPVTAAARGARAARSATRSPPID